jgi:serpin B
MRRVVTLTLAAATAVLFALAPGTAFARRAGQPALTPGQSTAALGLDLLRKLPPGNLVFSPDSVETAVAMAGTGAGGTTARQIAQVLHLGLPAAFGSIGGLQARIAAEQAAAAHGAPEAPQLNIADGLFLQEGFPAAAPFLASLSQNFSATPQTVNFDSRPAAAVREINEWVSRNTGGLIPSILSNVSEEAKLILANAVYLHAYWTRQFKAKDVSPGVFHGPRAGVQVPFMHQTESLPFSAGDGYEAVELPYRSSTLSLMVMLPTGQSLTTLQHGLSATQLSRIAARMKPTELKLALPKFQLALRTELGPVLSSLGMPLAFSEAADFSRIDPAAHLAISRILQAADIEVQEEGTVAAAATIVEIEATAREIEPPARPFDADRPFLYFLRDQKTGAVLFAGRLVNAAGAQS